MGILFHFSVILLTIFSYFWQIYNLFPNIFAQLPRSAEAWYHGLIP